MISAPQSRCGAIGLSSFFPLAQLTVITSLLLGSVTLRAQETVSKVPGNSSVDASKTPPLTLDVFVVSTTKIASFSSEHVQAGTFRDLDPLDVPLTVNAVTREVMEAQAVEGLFDALKNVAGVSRSQQSGATFDNIAIRGVALANRDNFRLNGSLPIINLIWSPMENKERIEVLKGAAALYYGFVAPGGVVNYVTKRPAQTPVQTINFFANEHGGYGGSVDFSRLRKTRNGYFGVRLTAGAGKEEIGVDDFAGDHRFATLSADWRVGQKLLFRLDYEHIEKNVTDQTTYTVAVANGAVLIPPVPSNKLNLGAAWMRNSAYADNALLRTDIILSRSWTLVVEGGVAKLGRDRVNSSFAIANVATGAGTLTIPFAKDLAYKNTNGRVELYGQFATGPLDHNLSVGWTANSRKQDSPTPPNIRVPQNLYSPVAIAETDMVAPTVAHVYNWISDRGFYAFDRIEMMSDRLQLIAGGRLSSFDNRAGTVSPPVTTYKQENTFSPAASVLYKISANTSIYASYLEALEAGATAASNLANAGEVLPPLTSTQKELGVKAKLWTRALVQLGLFQMDRPSSFVDTTTNRLTANGLARSKGAELSISGELAPTLSTMASAMILNSDQLNSRNTLTFGKPTENTPELTLSGFVEWRPAKFKGLGLSGGAFYMGSRQANNNGQGALGGYTTYSAGISYAFNAGKGKYVVRLTGSNLTDKNAWGSVGQGSFTTTIPRLLKMSIQARF